MNMLLRRIPPLQAGDHLTVAEFERRYAVMPENVKAELIEGVVYLPTPASGDYHGVPQSSMISTRNSGPTNAMPFRNTSFGGSMMMPSTGLSSKTNATARSHPTKKASSRAWCFQAFGSMPGL